METGIRNIQKKILKILSRHSKTFALSGGTALELYYLHHRFSKDLDLFSPQYGIGEIDNLVSRFERETGGKVILENELTAAGYAKVRFYSMAAKGTRIPLKIDFVEDVIFTKPKIRRFEGVRVYDVEHIYIQKVAAVTGLRLRRDDIGREITMGRRAARDVFDIYTLSSKVAPLHEFLCKLPREQQRGVIQWYRSFSRQELKTELLDLEIYDKKFDCSRMLRYLDSEIREFINRVIE